MADELIVRVGAQAGPIKEGMDDAARAVREGTATMRELLEQLARGSVYQTERIAEAVERSGDRVVRSQRETADKSAAAHRAWLDSWGLAVVAWNQGLELIQKGMRAVEVTWDQTMGRVIARGEEFDALGKRLSTDVAQLSAFELVARQTGISLAELGTGYRALSRALVDAKDTSSEAYRVLVQGLGLTNTELERLRAANPQDAILAIGQALERFEDGAEKADAAQLLFGRSYQSIIQLLREGEDTIRNNLALAQRLGLVMSTEQAAAADQLGDSFGLLEAAWEGLMTRMLGDETFLRTLAGLVEDAATEFGDLGAAMPEQQAQALRDAILDVARELRSLMPDAQDVAGTLRKVAEAMEAVARWKHAIAGAGAGIIPGAIVGGVAAGPLGAVVGAAGGAALGARVAGGLYDVPAQRAADTQRAVDAASNLLRESEGLSGVGMTTEEGVAIPSTSLGSPRTLPTPTAAAGSRPTLNVPDDPGKASSAADKARREAFAALAREQQEALLREKDNAEARLQIVTQFTEQVKERFGAESEEFARQKVVQTKAEQDAADQRARIAEIEMDARHQAEMVALEQERKDIEFRRDLGIISRDDAVKELQDHLQKRLDLLRRFAAEAKDVAGDDPVKQAEIDAGLAQDTQATENEGKDVQRDAIKEQKKEIEQDMDELFGSIGQAADRMVEGMLQGTRKFSAAWKDLGRGMLAQFISTTIQMAAKWAATQATMLAVQVLTDQLGVQSTALAAIQKRAIESQEARKSILTSAASAAGKAYDAMAGIPYVGPILGAIAAAATFAAVVGFSAYVSAEGGMERVPSGGALAQLHPDEMVLPKRVADPIRAMALGYTGGARGGGLIADPFGEASDARALTVSPDLLGRVRGGGQPSLDGLELPSEPSVSHTTIEIHATDAKSFARMLDTPEAGRVMAKRVEKAARLQQRSQRPRPR